MKGDGLLIKLREQTLLLNSQITNDYPWIGPFIKEHPSFKRSELPTLPIDHQRFFKDFFNKVVYQAGSEWKSDPKKLFEICDDDCFEQCDLCHQPIKFVCYIVNTLNGKELKVGRECVKNFAMNLGVPLDKIFKERAKIKRLEKLDTAIPGIERITKSCRIINPITELSRKSINC